MLKMIKVTKFKRVFISHLFSVLPQFTGEEVFGQCLDLHEFYEIYVNLKGGQRLDYLTFLDTFYLFNDDQNFKNSDYKKYLKDVGAYLIQFLARAQPLV